MAAYFTPATFRFLADLKKHNDRDWFKAEKERWEKEARDPFLRLIADLEPRIAKLSKWIVVDARPNNGSMMRMYRDTRFSKDKTPLKTGMAAHFEHVKGQPGGAPGLYLHIEPGESGIGSGIWRPEPGALKHIRDAIAADSRGWEKAVGAREFKTGCGMIGESLQRPPKGYDPNHPAIEDLKRKDFAISHPLGDQEILSDKLLDVVADGFKAHAKFAAFLCKALDLPF